LLDIRHRHDRCHLDLCVQTKEEALGNFHHLRGVAHIHDEEPGSFTTLRAEIGGLRLQLLRDLVQNFSYLAGPNCLVASINRERKLNHHAHRLPPFHSIYSTQSPWVRFMAKIPASSR